MIFRIKTKRAKNSLELVDELWRNLVIQQIEYFIDESIHYAVFYDETTLFKEEKNNDFPQPIEDTRIKIIEFLKKQQDTQRKHKIQDYFMIHYYEKNLHHPKADLDRKINFLEKLHQLYLTSSLKLRTSQFKKMKTNATTYIQKFIHRVKNIFNKKKINIENTFKKIDEQQHHAAENLVRDFEIVLKDLKSKAAKAQDKELEKIYLDTSKVYNQLATLKNFLRGKNESNACIAHANQYLKRVLYVRSKSQTLLEKPTKYFFAKPAKNCEIEEMIFLFNSQYNEDFFKNLFSLNRLIQSQYEISPDGYYRLIYNTQKYLSADQMLDFYQRFKQEAHSLLQQLRNCFKSHYIQDAESETTKILQYSLTVAMDFISGIEKYLKQSNFIDEGIFHGDDLDYFHPSTISYEAENDSQMNPLNPREISLVRTLIDAYHQYHGKIARVDTQKKFVFN